MNKKETAISIAVRQICQWEYNKEWEYNTERWCVEKAKSIFRDLVRKQVKVSPATAEACAIYSDLQGREISFPPSNLSPMHGEALTEFAEQRKLQAELCN